MRKIVFICAMVLAVLACKKHIPTEEPAGNIEVYVTLYDEQGNKQAGGAGVTVTIIDSSNNNNLTSYYLKDTTGTSSTCLFTNVPKGTYTLIFSKEGYGTIIKYNVHFIPELASYIISQNLAVTSSTVASNLTFTHGTDSIVSLACNISSSQATYSSVRFFWGTDSTISKDSNYTAMVLCNTINNTISPGVVGFSFVPSQYVVDSATTPYFIPSGTKLYAIAYGEINDPTPYTDVTVTNREYANKKKKYPNGVTVYPNLNTATPIDTLITR